MRSRARGQPDRTRFAACCAHVNFAGSDEVVDRPDTMPGIAPPDAAMVARAIIEGCGLVVVG